MPAASRKTSVCKMSPFFERGASNVTLLDLAKLLQQPLKFIDDRLLRVIGQRLLVQQP